MAEKYKELIGEILDKTDDPRILQCVYTVAHNLTVDLEKGASLPQSSKVL